VRPTLSELRTLLRQLDGQPADAIESETVECKPWQAESQHFADQAKKLRESVVCLANARGGVILLGIEDRRRTRRDAIHGVGALPADRLRKAIYDGTDPHVLVDCEELIEPEGRVLALFVPRGLGTHTTSEGVAKIRVGKDCQPLTGSMLAQRLGAGTQLDYSAQIVGGASMGDLDPDALKQYQRILATEGRKPELGRQEPRELLENLGLVQDGQVTLAAVLLLGRSPALARWAPQHELIFLRYVSRTRYDVRHNLKGPILKVLDRIQELLEAHAKLSTHAAGSLGELTTPDLSWWTAREGVLNALVHRDYFLRQSIYVELREGRVEITSPGGFIGGVTPKNVLRHPPVRRNPLLAASLESAGLVNRAGMGVDRIYEELLRAGKSLPRYEADEGSVRLVLPTETHAAFARFVAEERRAGRELGLDDLILLRGVAERGQIDRWSAAEDLQCGEAEGANALVSLRERGYLTPRGRGRGTAYSLARSFSELIRGEQATLEGLDLDTAAVSLRVQAILRERGRLTNADVRRISGYSRTDALRLVRTLQTEGVLRMEGRGRGAHYVPVNQTGEGSSPAKRPRRQVEPEHDES
jgi:ATP-dependent DNA helicase RecG